ncbi:hypothetical protein TNCV_4860941 [Trichonephila clavipes]|nr:hypothetical protein TNCV_4860941 [Trichonephila clavipes]
MQTYETKGKETLLSQQKKHQLRNRICFSIFDQTREVVRRFCPELLDNHLTTTASHNYKPQYPDNSSLFYHTFTSSYCVWKEKKKLIADIQNSKRTTKKESMAFLLLNSYDEEGVSTIQYGSEPPFRGSNGIEPLKEY